MRKPHGGGVGKSLIYNVLCFIHGRTHGLRALVAPLLLVVMAVVSGCRSESPESMGERVTVRAEVAPQLTAQRMWFAVYAAMADAGVVERGDFPAFEKLLAAACPEGLPRRLDVRDLRRLNVLSFAGPIGIWTERNAPVTGSTFGKYERLALQTLELLRGKG